MLLLMSAALVQAVFLSDPSADVHRGVVTAFAALRLLRLIRLIAVIKVRECRAMHSNLPPPLASSSCVGLPARSTTNKPSCKELTRW